MALNYKKITQFGVVAGATTGYFLSGNKDPKSMVEYCLWGGLFGSMIFPAAVGVYSHYTGGREGRSNREVAPANTGRRGNLEDNIITEEEITIMHAKRQRRSSL